MSPLKLSQISTLWDYINRAMPWNAPKTLTADEVYALTAYILSLGRIVPDEHSRPGIAWAQAWGPDQPGAVVWGRVGSGKSTLLCRLLRRLEGCSQKEVAARLNISVKTVEAQLTRALKRCAHFMAKHDVVRPHPKGGR